MKWIRVARGQKRECGFMSKLVEWSQAWLGSGGGQLAQGEDDTRKVNFFKRGREKENLAWVGKGELEMEQMKAKGHGLLPLKSKLKRWKLE